MRISAVLAGIAFLSAPVFSATETLAKAECVPASATVSQSGPCQGNNGFGNGADAVGGTPGNSNPKGPPGGTPPGNPNPNGQSGR